MSEHAALVAGLREYPVCGCNGCWNALQLAADAIEAVETKAAARNDLIAELQEGSRTDARKIANLQTCQCDGCEESLEGEAYCERCYSALERERNEALETSLVHLARAEEAEKHEAIAVADNAALLRVVALERSMGASCNESECTNELCVVVNAAGNSDHPGAAVLARIERLEAVKDATQAFLDWMGDGEEYEVRLAPVRAALDAAESEVE